MTPPYKIPPRPKAATLFMAAPVVFLGSLGLAVAILFVVTRFGDATAQGERVEIEFSGSCMAEAAPVLSARADQIGMPASLSGNTMVATLPNMENARILVPQLLITMGAFQADDANGKTHLTNKQIHEVAIDLDESGMPVTYVKLNADGRAILKNADDQTVLTPTVDGSAFPDIGIDALKDEPVIALHSGSGMTADRMKRAADLAIVLEHGPLPCPLRIVGVSAIPAAQE